MCEYCVEKNNIFSGINLTNFLYIVFGLDFLTVESSFIISADFIFLIKGCSNITMPCRSSINFNKNLISVKSFENLQLKVTRCSVWGWCGIDVTESCCAILAFLKGVQYPANPNLVHDHSFPLFFFKFRWQHFLFLWWKFWISSEWVLSFHQWVFQQGKKTCIL